jgi:glycosyltransferase involved in cell wall biosynthesis
VIGSNLGGIAELVQHGTGGLLVEPTSVEAWAGALRSLCSSELLPRLRDGVRPPRSVRAVACEMQQIYVNALQTLDARTSLLSAT